MNIQCNTGVRYNSIQSGIITSGQVSNNMSIVKCQISGVRYHVLSDNMSSTGVRYQVSDQVSSITYQCQIINMSVSGELSTGLQHYISGNHLVM